MTDVLPINTINPAEVTDLGEEQIWLHVPSEQATCTCFYGQKLLCLFTITIGRGRYYVHTESLFTLSLNTL